MLQIQEMESTILDLENQNIQQANVTRSKAQAVSSTRHKNNLKVIKKLSLSYQQRAFWRWRDQVNSYYKAQAQTNLVLSRVRKRFLIESFSIYKGVWLK